MWPKCSQSVQCIQTSIRKVEWWFGWNGQKKRLIFIVLNRKGKAVDTSPAGDTNDEPEVLETVEVSVIKTTGYMLCKT